MNVNLSINRTHKIPITVDFAHLSIGDVFTRVDNCQRLLIKVDSLYYRDLYETPIFEADATLRCYIVQDIDITYSLRYGK